MSLKATLHTFHKNIDLDIAYIITTKFFFIIDFFYFFFHQNIFYLIATATTTPHKNKTKKNCLFRMVSEFPTTHNHLHSIREAKTWLPAPVSSLIRNWVQELVQEGSKSAFFCFLPELSHTAAH